MSSDLDLPLPRSLTRHGVHSHLQAATGALLEAEEGKQKQDRLSQEDQATGVEGQASLQALGAHSAHPESRSQSGVELGWGREAPSWLPEPHQGQSEWAAPATLPSVSISR